MMTNVAAQAIGFAFTVSDSGIEILQNVTDSLFCGGWKVYYHNLILTPLEAFQCLLGLLHSVLFISGGVFFRVCQPPLSSACCFAGVFFLRIAAQATAP